MGFEADEEILQDFIIESGEILELLSEQLVDLEQNPDDKELLNAIFRGFHTVKGGAGFLQLDTLVECCHVAENVFDNLRNGKRSVTSELMDVVLQALDSVNAMFDQVRAQEPVAAADRDLLQALSKFAVEETEDSVDAEEPATTIAQNEPVAASSGDITDDEFEHLVSALGDNPEENESSVSPPSGDITDDEFEQLLDDLHGKETSKADTSAPASEKESKAPAPNGDITDDEFEKLLDDLHGQGSFSSENSSVQTKSAAAPEDAKTSNAKNTKKEASASNLITDDEFEKLLDDLHGSSDSPIIEKKNPVAAPAVKSKSSATSAQPAKAPIEKPAHSKPVAAPKPKAKVHAKENSIATETTVRVDTRRLDDIMNMVGELVLVRNRLKRLGDASDDEAMQKAVSNLDVVTGDLQSSVMQTRMQPIKKVFGRFPRVVRDLARNLKKEVNLILNGEDTDLDKNLVEALSDPLVHLVRNAVDHGVEIPEIREKSGKPRVGKVLLSAEQEGDHILLSIEDDGAGMDPDVLRKKAVEKGLFDEDAAERLTKAECFNLIFAPGFSTKTEISDVSGRGVGMDVVKTKITQLNGTLSIDSELGKGSRIIIKVPLTLAIMPTLMVMLGEQSFAFPLVSVVEIFHFDLTKTNVVDGQECVVVRDNVYPLFHIKRWLVKRNREATATSGHVVIVSVGTKRVGFVVDQLIGQEEVVIKPLGNMLHGTPGMAGATITGDGKIALILDIPSMLQRYA